MSTTITNKAASLGLVLVSCTALSPSASARHEGATPAPASCEPVQLSPTDWSALRAAFEAQRRAAMDVGAGFRARDPAQRWWLEFDGRGVRAHPDEGTWTWGLELERWGFAGNELEVDAIESAAAAGPRVTYAWGGGLSEWYVNGARGLEHGFTLEHRPPLPIGTDAPGPLALGLRVRGPLSARLHADGRGASFLGPGGEVVLGYSGLAAFDADGRELPARLTSTPQGLAIEVHEQGARYPLTIDPIVQQAYLKASNTAEHAFFAHALSAWGDTVAIGAFGEDGASTGVDGDQAALTENAAGAVYVFVRSGGAWSQEAYLKASNTDKGDNFGGALALSGDTLAVGAHRESSDTAGVDGDQTNSGANSSGAVYVFRRSAGAWSQEAYVKASNPDPNDNFGKALALAGDTLVVAAPFESSAAAGVGGDQSSNLAPGAGAVYVFERGGGVWSQSAYLKASNAEADDQFGTSVALDGDTLVVGARRESSGATGVGGDQSDGSAFNSGAAYVFVREGGGWSQEAYLKASNTDIGDEFGTAVAVSGDTVVVGAPKEMSATVGVNGNQESNVLALGGAAYVFVRSGGAWSQQAYLKGFNQNARTFGESLAVLGDRVLVGSPFDNGNAKGVNGNPFAGFDTVFYSGAGYLFERSGTTWTEAAYLKASNTGIEDHLGKAVALTADLAVLGASAERSGATGVNGDQGDDSHLFAGAAYVFDLASPVGPFCAQLKPTSVADCQPLLSVTGTSLAHDAWQLGNVPLGPTTTSSQALFLYTAGPGMGLSPFWSTLSSGSLCLRSFQRASPGCAPLSLTGVPNSCANAFPPFWPRCGAGALGILPGHDVNVQAWYRDPDVGFEGAGLSNAVFYTATP